MHRFLRLAPTVLLLATLVTGGPVRALAPAVAVAGESATTAARESQGITAAQDDNNQQPPRGTTHFGQSSGLLPRDKLVLESAIQVDLDKETVRLALYKGDANGKTVWFVLLDASDLGLADDLRMAFRPAEAL